MKTVFISVSFALFANTAMAANSPETLQQAVLLLEEGSPQVAYSLLAENLDQSSKNPQEWFLLAMSAKESGRPAKENIRYFKKILELDPTADRVKLELARLLYKQGKTKAAKRYFTEVKANKPPAAVGKNIDSFVAATSSVKKKSWNLRASLGWMSDSNVNSGPTTDSVLMFGVPFQLSTDAKETSDTAWKAGIAFDHLKKLSDRTSWQSSLSLSTTDYNQIDVLDSSSLAASTGMTWQLGGKTILSVPLVYDRVKVGHEKSYYYYSYGIAPQLRYQTNQKTSLNLTTTASEKKYNDQGDRDSKKWSISPSVNHRLSKTDSLNFGLTYGKDNSGIDTFSNRTLSANAGYSHIFKNGIRGNLNYSFNDTKYDAIEAAYTEVRHDKASTIAASVSYPIKKIKSNLSLSISHTDNSSSLDLYNYDRDQVSLSLQKMF